MIEERDALVIGGGPGGATAALLLARAGWLVTLLERKRFPRPKVCGEYLSATNWPLLDQLGIGEVIRDTAGPPVNRVGLFANRAVLSTEWPRPDDRTRRWGRALARDKLDTLLVARATEAGAEVLQPWSARELVREGGDYRCQAESSITGALTNLRARIVVLAHGSWEAGSLSSQSARPPSRPSDLLAFKAHFRDSDLPQGMMPLLAFPGGYGGMVHCDEGRVSVSFCIRRDRLAKIRLPGHEAGEAVLQHVLDSCLGVRRALAGATRAGPWLAAGPIRPGIRLHIQLGLFPVGNVAGEAHPAVAEGISMAMQSSWLLTQLLIAWRKQGARRTALRAVGEAYAAAWRRRFGPRLYASSALAHWAMRPAVVAGTLPLVQNFPALLNWGARLSGKATRVVAL